MDLTKVEVDLDWEAYFKDFDATHGGNPVPYRKARLLWQDGWSYAKDDPAGPEYAPPTDTHTLNRLKLYYWMSRQRRVHQELAAVKSIYDNLAHHQSLKSGRLHQRIRYLDDEGKTKVISQPVDLDIYLGHIKAVEAELQEIEQQLLSFRSSGQ